MKKQQRRNWNAVLAVLAVLLIAIAAFAAGAVCGVPVATRAEAAPEPMAAPTAAPVLVTLAPPPGAVWMNAGDDGYWDIPKPPAPTVPPSYKYHGWTDADAAMLARLADRWGAATESDAMKLYSVAINRMPDASVYDAARGMGAPKSGECTAAALQAAKDWLDGDWALYGTFCTHFVVDAAGAVEIW